MGENKEQVVAAAWPPLPFRGPFLVPFRSLAGPIGAPGTRSRCVGKRGATESRG